MLRNKVQSELILTGVPEALARLEQRSGQEGKGISKTREMTMRRSSGDLKVGLFKVENPAAEQEGTPGAIRRLIGWARAEKLFVTVEPNCSTGNPYTEEGSPWSWEGSPWSWEGSPWDWESNTAVAKVIAVGATPTEGKAKFWQQYAFQKIGLTDLTGKRLAALETHQGEGVLVGVFDTLPSKPLNLPWLTLHPSATPLTSPQDQVTRDFSDHGLVAASLINAVAPKAQVHLYEVLTADAYGSMFPLLDAIAAFIALAAGRPAVINLSLGSMCPNPLSPALQALLQKATDQGIVVCAAAGNRGKLAAKVSTLMNSQVPAAFPNVISVSASNGNDERATFSQRGDLAAPGGEDLGALGPGDAEDIIGMGVSDPAGTPSGYVAMDGGTSFSTPLVAGSAVLVLEQRLIQGLTLSADTHVQVLNTLKAGCRVTVPAAERLEYSGLGAGVIHLPSIFGLSLI